MITLKATHTLPQYITMVALGECIYGTSLLTVGNKCTLQHNQIQKEETLVGTYGKAMHEIQTGLTPLWKYAQQISKLEAVQHGTIAPRLMVRYMATCRTDSIMTMDGLITITHGIVGLKVE